MNVEEKSPLIKDSDGVVINNNKESSVVINSEKEEKYVGKGGIWGSVFNLTNTVIGAGVLAYPFSYLSTGLVSGVIFTMIIVVLCGFSLLVLAYAGAVAGGCRTYQDVLRVYLGKFWVLFSEVLFIVNLTGACITYLIIVGDTITPFFNVIMGEYFYFSDRRIVILFISCLIIFPLLLLREISRLGYSSFVAVVGVLYLTGMFIVVCIIDWSSGIPIEESAIEHVILNTNMYEGVMPQFFIAIPIIAFSFQGIELVCIPIYYELKNQNLRNMMIIIVLSLVFSVGFYIVIGVLGYLRFGDGTMPNVLVSFPEEYVPALIARALMGLTVTLSYPLFFYAERLAVFSMFYPKTALKGKIPSVPFAVITIVLFVTSVIPSMYLTDISDVLGIIGSVGAITFIFILPMFILWLLIQRSNIAMWLKILSYIGVMIILICATILLIAGDLVTIVKIVAEYTHPEV